MRRRRAEVDRPCHGGDWRADGTWETYGVGTLLTMAPLERPAWSSDDPSVRPYCYTWPEWWARACVHERREWLTDERDRQGLSAVDVRARLDAVWDGLSADERRLARVVLRVEPLRAVE